MVQLLLVPLLLSFFKASQLETSLFHNVERKKGMRVAFITFVYVPIADPPLK